MDGAKTTPKPPSVGSSGNAQVFTVEGHPLIKEVQFSPESPLSTHGGQYYKFTFTDGTKVKVIDPENYKVKYKSNSAGVFEADIEKNTVFYNSSGHGLVYKNDIWVLK
jgi:filamentous hemagglutinin